MKNHINVGSKLLQTNKKWSYLKQKQREWIAITTKAEYDNYIAKYKKTPGKNGKAEIIDSVYDKINEREIWIPFYEAKAHIGKYVDQQNRKAHDLVSEDGEIITVVPIKKMKKNIALYINQTAKIPPNKIRDSNLKDMLRDFNSKLYKKTGAKVLKDDDLLSVYDNIRKELLTEYNANGQLYVETKKLNKRLTVLETERMRLRKMHSGDLKEISRIISDIEVMYAWERAFATKKDALDWII